MPDYELERTIARNAARLAGQLCLAVRQEMLGGSPDEARIEKAGREPVTVADYGAQAIVLHHIAEHFPGDGTIAEERAAEFNGLASDEQQSQVVDHVGRLLRRTVTTADVQQWLDFGRGQEVSRIWTVDPIDGTKGFLRGDQFAVAVALLVDGEPVVGALACPVMPYDPEQPDAGSGVVAVAVKGQGGVLESFDGADSRPLKGSPVAEASQGRTVESVESGHTDHSFSAQAFASAGLGGGVVRMDSQAKYVAVADQRAEVYLRNSRGKDYREKIWDHAAGVLIVNEAGGRVTDLNGNLLDFSLGERLEQNQGILATNGHLHDALLQAIKSVRASG